MIRYLKVLGLVVAFTCALGAPVPEAGATPFQFHTETIPSKITGKQHSGNEVIGTNGGNISCSEVTQEGDASGTTTVSVTLTATYSECTAFGFMKVPFNMNECHITFTAITREGTAYEGKKDIACLTKPIEILVPGCTVTIGSQNNLGKITYTNIGSGSTREVTIDSAINGIKYVEHNSGLFPTCASNEIETSNGTATGSMLLTAELPLIKTHHAFFVG